jgi:hypothetical protein
MLKALFTALVVTALAVPAQAQTDTHGGGQTPPSGQRRLVEVAFVVDTTGSMGPLIEGAKRSIWRIARSIIETNPEAEVRMALVAYRDIGDEYVTRRFELTRDIQGLYGELLNFRAVGGGDWPESVNEALDVAVTRLAWTQGPHVDRIVFLVGDAPPHMDYAQDRKYHEVLGEARQRGIVVNAVQAGRARDTERVWREIARLGGGRYIPIPQDGGPVARIDTPYDRQIIELQIEINRTIVPYGPRAQRESVQQRAGQIAAAPSPAAASDMAAYVNRVGRGRDAITGQGDLVSDVLRGGRRLEDVPVADLPEELRSLSNDERLARLRAQDERRQQLQRRMAELTEQRDQAVRAAETARPVPAPAFDGAVQDALRAQVRR